MVDNFREIVVSKLGKESWTIPSAFLGEAQFENVQTSLFDWDLVEAYQFSQHQLPAAQPVLIPMVTF